jgi:hypothetical protein
MTVDTTSARSRRAMLTGSLVALGAVIAQALGRPLPAQAGGNALILGQQNSTDAASTSITRPDDASNLTLATSTYAAFGNVFTPAGIGVGGRAQANGAKGVAGSTNGHHSQVAVLADTTGGVGEGISVKALTKNGVGVYAECTGGAAIVAEGMTVFSRSGKASFAAGQSARTLSAGRVTADTLVVATIQGDVTGTWVRGVTVNVAKQQFTIRLNRAAPKTLKVGWFVVN